MKREAEQNVEGEEIPGDQTWPPNKIASARIYVAIYLLHLICISGMHKLAMIHCRISLIHVKQQQQIRKE